VTSGLEMETAYYGVGASTICHLLTYLDTYPLLTAPGPTQGCLHLVTVTITTSDKLTLLTMLIN